MAITFDAPSSSWQTASRTTVEPRISYPIPQNASAVFYEHAFAQNPAYWSPSALDAVMASTTLDSAIDSSTTTIAVASTDGFPAQGSVKINSEIIPYTGRTATTFTGATVVSYHAPTAVNSTAYLVEETPQQSVSGDMVEWTKKFATVPDAWSEYSESAFTFPGYYNDTAESNFRSPQAINATIKSTLTYALTTDPYTDLDVANQMFRVINDATDKTVVNYVNASTVPTYTTYTGYVSGSTLIYSAQSTLARFAGNIWVRTDFQTKAQ